MIQRDSMMVRADARAVGMQTATTVRAHRNSWSRGMRGRTIGVAPGTEATATEATFLRILPDGTRSIESVRSVRRTASKSTRGPAVNYSTGRRIPETARLTIESDAFNA